MRSVCGAETSILAEQEECESAKKEICMNKSWGGGGLTSNHLTASTGETPSDTAELNYGFNWKILSYDSVISLRSTRNTKGVLYFLMH